MSNIVVPPAILRHYTCTDHGAVGIVRDRELRPHWHPLLRRHIVWLTDLDQPDRWALGLTSTTLCCDRTAIRVSVHSHNEDNEPIVAPWWQYAREMPRALRDVIEQDGLPMHWWVSERPVPVIAIVATSVTAHAGPSTLGTLT